MRIATTPTHTFKFPDNVSVDDIVEAQFVYGQNGNQILTKNLDDFEKNSEKNTLFIELTQDETKLFAPSEALVQARVKTNGGVVMASQIVIFEVSPVLNSEELWTTA